MNYFLGGLLGIFGLLVVLWLGRAAQQAGQLGKVWSLIKLGLVIGAAAFAAKWLGLF